jgi:hypothetical protein
VAGLPKPEKHKIWMAHGTEGFDSEYGEFQDHAHKLLLEKGYSLNQIFPSLNTKVTRIPKLLGLTKPQIRFDIG